MKSRHVIYISILIFVVVCGGVVFSSQRPAEYKTMFSIFFRDWTQPELSRDAIKPVMATDGYRLPVDIGQSTVLPITPQGATSVGDSPWTVTSTPASWTMTASATDYALWNLGTVTVWISHNNGGATISAGIPLVASGSISRDAAHGLVVWAVASVTQYLIRAEGQR